ncbi:right-handed parallel beta-helix repeat-containing protein, partial [Streptomyces sp. SID3343]|uniref:right-handed parallel beta-helix repeat-containing protein n=1 Tax=Streptomyces sp. SID3343 TaxID=2690260 RepID=UPI0013C08B47
MRGNRGADARRTIADAVSAAGDGERVLLAPGVYHEHIVLGRSVVLVAEQGPGSVRLTGAQDVALTVTGGGAVRIEGLVLVGADADAPAVRLTGSADVLFDDCRIEGGRLDIADAARVKVTGGRISGARVAGVAVSGDARLSMTGCRVQEIEGAGLLLAGAAAVTVADSVITRTDVGLWVRDAATVQARGSHFAESARNALLAEDSSVVGLDGCRGSDSGADAVIVRGDAKLTLRSCVVERAGASGLAVSGRACANVLDGQIVAAGLSGVVAEDRARLDVVGGLIRSTGANGVFARGTARVTLDGVAVADTAFTAVHLDEHTHGELAAVVLGPTPEHGLCVAGAAEVLASGLLVRSAAMTGVHVGGSGSARLVGSAVHRSGIGLRVEDGADTEVEDCAFAHTERAGVEVGPGARP